MKIIKEEIEQEVTSNEIKDDQYKEKTEKAKEEAEDLINPMKRKNEKAFLGAKKQPEPKKVKEPKATLDESLFEDAENESLKEARHKNYRHLSWEVDDRFIKDNGQVQFMLPNPRSKYKVFGSKWFTLNDNNKFSNTDMKGWGFSDASEFFDWADNQAREKGYEPDRSPIKKYLDLFENPIPYISDHAIDADPLKEDLNEDDFSDFNSAFYNAIADVLYEYRDHEGITRNDVERAYAFFDSHFYDSDDNENVVDESLNESSNAEWDANEEDAKKILLDTANNLIQKYGFDTTPEYVGGGYDRINRWVPDGKISLSYRVYIPLKNRKDESIARKNLPFNNIPAIWEAERDRPYVSYEGGYILVDLYKLVDDISINNESLKEAIGQEEVDRLYDYVSDYIYHYYDEIIKNMSQEEIDQFISDLSSTMKDYASHWQEENESLKESLTTKDREEAIEYIDDFLSKYDFYSELDAEDAKYICSSLETIMLDHIFWLDKLRKENEEDEEDTLEEARSKKQKEEENTLWDRVYSELASGKDTAVEGPHKIKAGKSDRYRYDDQIFIPSDGIGVHVETKDDLKFAKKVADHFGLKFKSYSEPCNQGTKTAWAGVIIIPEDMYEETPEETKARLAKK